ncbi:MAG: hypothetical protein WCF67_04930 [Chitinophagaceae bacterium]
MARYFLFSFLLLVSGCSSVRNTTNTNSANTVILPGWMKGHFMDDYGIRYTVNDTLFRQHPSALYHILEWNEKEQYLLVKNDEGNPTEKGLYSRIDYMQFTNMQPYLWGFCLTVYNAQDTGAAKKAPFADRENPKKGCNGFPFSRMKVN